MRQVQCLGCRPVLLAGTILTSCFMVSAPARAADKNVTRLDTVTVVATKTAQPAHDVPAMASIIDAQGDASLAQPQSLSDLFANTPAVQFGGSGRRNGQVPVMRGFDSNSILVQFDGVRQNFESGHDGRFFIDPSLVKQVEVVRGPASSLYGSGGLGGVISFRTLEAQDLLAPGEDFGARISGDYTSVNRGFSETATVFGRHGDFDALLALTKADSENVELGDGRELRSDDDLWSGIANLNWYAGEHGTVTFGLNGYDLDAVEPNNPQVGPGDSTANDTVEKDTRSLTSRLKYNYDNAGHAWLNNFNAQIYRTDTRVEETLLAATLLGAVGDRIHRELETWGLNLDNQTYIEGKALGDHILTYGGEYYADEQDGGDSGNAGGTGDGIPDAKADTYGLFFQDEITFDAPAGAPGEFTLIPGVRFDRYESEDRTGNSQDESAVSPKIAASYRPTGWLMLFGSYAQAFRAPNLTEIYSTGTHFAIPPLGTNSFVPNPDLRPESSDTVEAGFGLNFDGVFEDDDEIRFKASRFWIDSDDFIDLDVNVTFAPCCGTSSNVNIPEAELWGHEMELGYENDWLLASVGTSYVTGKNKRTGEYLTNIQPFTVTTNLGYRMPEAGAVIGWRARYADEKDKVNAAADRIDGYGVHDLYATWNPPKIGNLTLHAGIDNIFDKDYQRVFADSPEPGRNIKLGATWRF